MGFIEKVAGAWRVVLERCSRRWVTLVCLLSVQVCRSLRVLEVKHVGPKYSLRQALLQPGRSHCRPIGSLLLALDRRSTGATALSPASSVLQDPEDPEQSPPLSRLEGRFDGGVHPSRLCADDRINAEQRHSTSIQSRPITFTFRC